MNSNILIPFIKFDVILLMIFADKFFKDYHAVHSNAKDWKNLVPPEYCGKCAIYTQDETARTPVPYLLHYRLRGEQLKDISRYEYSAIIDTVPAPKTEPSLQGRKSRTCYEFDHGHPLHATHQQVIRLKFKTPIIVGKKVR